MASEDQSVTVHFPNDFDHIAAEDIEVNGWVGTVIELQDGRTYDITFMSRGTFSQEIEEVFKGGQLCCSPVGVVVLPDVTVDAVKNVAQWLLQEGYFDEIKQKHT